MKMKFVLEIISFLVFIYYVNSEEYINNNNLDSSYSNVRCWSRRGQFPHLTYCDWFYNCWDGSVYEQKCPKGLVFNVFIRGCDYPDNVNCGSKVTSWELSSDKRKCPQPFGIFADVTDCSSFVMCVGGTPIPQACPRTLYFNPSSNVCDYPYNVIAPNCKVDPPPPPPPTGSFNCPQPNGIFAHMTDCDKFWICDNYNENLMFCPFGTLFDVRSSTCLRQDQVQCFGVGGSGGGEIYDFTEGPIFKALMQSSASQLDTAASSNIKRSSNETLTERNSTKNNQNNSTSF